ncbi:MAG: hypothetical protein SGPRY_005444 [Prymnesium sp.]
MRLCVADAAVSVQGEDPVPVTINNMILRGSSLRNTAYVLGLVVNTGIDTKVMQGARKPKARSSSIEKSLNPLIVIVRRPEHVVIILIILCTVASIARTTAANTLQDEAWYLDYQDAESTNFIWVILRFFVLLNAFVSVSLMLSIYVCKSIQAWFMQQSVNMYHEESDTPMKVRCMFLTDELGRISHVFSDKTGTLTQNIMQFRKCSIDGAAYGHGHTEIGIARLTRLGMAPSEISVSAEAEGSGGETNAVNFDGPELHRALKEATEHGERCRQFFLLLALCHTVVVDVVDGSQKLSASSPDEAALVAAAAFFGYEFVRRDNEQVYVRDVREDKEMVFTVLAVLEFSSARKRMSAIVRDESTGDIQILSKGADNVMLKFLAPGQEKLVQITEGHMKDHSNDGLRTLVLAKRNIDQARHASLLPGLSPRVTSASLVCKPSYERWHAEFVQARGSATELEKKDREEPNEIDRLMGLMEQDLVLLGSTAIEDKLQMGVPSAIADMSKAGISVWVLTGDKEETAINIAFACQLLDTSTKITIINKKTHPKREMITKTLNSAYGVASKALNTSVGSAEKHGLVIDGEAIEMVRLPLP